MLSAESRISLAAGCGHFAGTIALVAGWNGPYARPMKRILVTWVGHADLKAVDNSVENGLGPVAQALTSLAFDEAVLVCDLPKKEIEAYLEWLRPQTLAKLNPFYTTLSSPTNFSDIYGSAVNAVQLAQKIACGSADLTFHLSPGTPAMASIWIILAKTRYPADLLESSKGRGATRVDVPFDISADYLPDLLKRTDSVLVRLSEGAPPERLEFKDIIHRSDVMKRVLAAASLVAGRSVPILIEGESGTGKELLARAIHMSGPRSNRRFVAVNCGAIPSELVESELFGHEKGAFTGANTTREGFFCTADGGTLFLDEVGELPPSAQVKLLRVLQDGVVYRVGSDRPVRTDVRIMAATNRVLTEEIAKGRFRTDLFYRLAVAVLKLPPLRERPGDLSLLIRKLMDQVNEESRSEPGYTPRKLSAAAVNVLMQHSWPGNVRELLNTLRRAAIWTEGGTIGPEQARDAIIPAFSSSTCGILDKPLGNGLDIRLILEDVARHYLERALQEAGGNKTRAAELIGLPSYQTFTNWMTKYGIE